MLTFHSFTFVVFTRLICFFEFNVLCLFLIKLLDEFRQFTLTTRSKKLTLLKLNTREISVVTEFNYFTSCLIHSFKIT
jgi:hypothetical protein